VIEGPPGDPESQGPKEMVGLEGPPGDMGVRGILGPPGRKGDPGDEGNPTAAHKNILRIRIHIMPCEPHV